MAGLVTYHLRITMEAQTPVGLGEHKGAALRGALVGALVALPSALFFAWRFSRHKDEMRQDLKDIKGRLH